MSGRLTEDDYLKLLNERKCGKNFSSNHFVVSQDKKPSQEDILLNEKVRLPTNLNDSYQQSLVKNKSSKKRKMGIDPNLLRFL